MELYIIHYNLSITITTLQKWSVYFFTSRNKVSLNFSMDFSPSPREFISEQILPSWLICSINNLASCWRLNSKTVSRGWKYYLHWDNLFPRQNNEQRIKSPLGETSFLEIRYICFNIDENFKQVDFAVKLFSISKLYVTITRRKYKGNCKINEESLVQSGWKERLRFVENFISWHRW